MTQPSNVGPVESDHGFRLTTLVEAVPLSDGQARRFLTTGVPPWQEIASSTIVAERELTDAEVLGILTAAGESHTGAMIALVPRVVDAERLAVDGGEDEEQLHLTLAFLGAASTVPPAARGEIIKQLLHHAVDVPVTGSAFAVAEFNPQGDEPCVVLIVGDDTGALEELQWSVCETLGAVRDDGWVMPEQRSPWIPHVTLLYAEGGDVDVESLAELTGPIIFDRIRVAFSDEVVDIPLGEISS